MRLYFARHGESEANVLAETYADIERRFVPFVQGLVAKHGEEPVHFVLLGHGGLYVCMLPLVLAGLTPDFVWGRPFPNTGYVLAEARDGRLAPLEWCGEVLRLAQRG